MRDIILETDRLILRQYRETDLDSLHALLSDPITMKFWPSPFSIAESEAWLMRNRERYEKWGYGRWAMVMKDTGALVGDAGIVVAELDGQLENDLGYIVSRQYWGIGIATESAEACRDHAFEVLGLRRLCANMPFDHESSRRVAEKIGMTKEKEYHNARNRDILTYLYAVHKQP